LRLRPPEGPADRLRRSGGRENRTEVFGRRRAPRILEGGEGSRDVLESGERQSSFAGAELAEIRDFFEATADGCLVPGRCRSEDGLATGAGSGESGNQAEDDVELEGLEIDGALLPRKG